MSEAGALPFSRQEALRVLLRKAVVGLGLDIRVKIRETDEVVRGILSGPDTRFLDIRDGAPLKGLQHLAERILARDPRFDRAPIVEIEGQREEMDLELKKKAHAAAEEVRRTGLPVDLPPLNPYERRVVHLAISELEGVATRSTGEGAERRMSVIPDGEASPGDTPEPGDPEGSAEDQGA